MVQALLTAAKWIRSKITRRYTLNDANYWDRYALLWRLSGKSKHYEYLGNEWANEEVFLRLLEKYASGKSTALEIGCGGGRITSQAVTWLDRLHAADVSRGMLRISKKALSQSSNVQFHQIDGFTLSTFADDSLELVYSHDVFVHFSSLQVYPYLREIKRVLKPNGIALISFYNFTRHFELFKEMSLAYQQHHRFPPHMRVHFITEEMILTMLEDLALRPVEIDSENYLIVTAEKQTAGGPSAGLL